MAHLNPFDYMTASASTPTSGRVNFNFKHLGAFVQLKITMPQGGTLSSVTLSADEAVFVTEGVVDLTAKTPAIQSVTKSKTLTLDVEGVTTTGCFILRLIPGTENACKKAHYESPSLSSSFRAE